MAADLEENRRLKAELEKLRRQLDEADSGRKRGLLNVFRGKGQKTNALKVISKHMDVLEPVSDSRRPSLAASQSSSSSSFGQGYTNGSVPTAVGLARNGVNPLPQTSVAQLKPNSDGADHLKPNSDGADHIQPSSDGADHLKPNSDGADHVAKGTVLARAMQFSQSTQPEQPSQSRRNSQRPPSGIVSALEDEEITGFGEDLLADDPDESATAGGYLEVAADESTFFASTTSATPGSKGTSRRVSGEEVFGFGDDDGGDDGDDEHTAQSAAFGATQTSHLPPEQPADSSPAPTYARLRRNSSVVEAAKALMLSSTPQRAATGKPDDNDALAVNREARARIRQLEKARMDALAAQETNEQRIRREAAERVKAREEKQRLQQEADKRLEAATAEQRRVEAAREASFRLEKQRLQEQHLQQERERQERERAEQARVDAERAAAAVKAAEEKARKEAAEAVEAEQAARRAAEQAEAAERAKREAEEAAARASKEQKARLEAEAVAAAERLRKEEALAAAAREKARKEAEEAVEAERLRVEAEKAALEAQRRREQEEAAARQAAERARQETAAAEAAAKARAEAEQEAARVKAETERLRREAELARQEAERIKREAEDEARREQQRLHAEAEAARLAQQRLFAEAEAARREQQRLKEEAQQHELREAEERKQQALAERQRLEAEVRALETATQRAAAAAQSPSPTSGDVGYRDAAEQWAREQSQQQQLQAQPVYYGDEDEDDDQQNQPTPPPQPQPTASQPLAPDNGPSAAPAAATPAGLPVLGAEIPKFDHYVVATFDIQRFAQLDYRLVPDDILPAPVRNLRVNRYLDILPPERTRVKLAVQEGGHPVVSSYINASYIRGVFGNKEDFILTMGPLPDTCESFWRMIVEKNVPLILMVTKLVEGDTEKCSPYFPTKPKKSKRFGSVRVTLENQEKTKDWTSSEFSVLIGDKTYNVAHMWYTSWPDHGVPKKKNGTMDATTVLQFVSKIQTVKDKWPNRPVCVHCSAGVGRAGTIVSIYTSVMLLQHCGRVDPLKVIDTLRRDRPAIVQTTEQYQLLHAAVVSFAKGQSFSLIDVDPDRMKPLPFYAKDDEDEQVHGTAVGKIWYHGWMDSDKAEAIVSGYSQKNGTFLLYKQQGLFRDRPTGAHDYVLCVMFRKKPTHHLIYMRPMDGVFVLNNTAFGDNKSIEQLVETLVQPDVPGWPVPLTTPVPGHNYTASL